MDIVCYILAGVSVLLGAITAVFYTTNRAKDAFVTKLMASTAFILAGISAISMGYRDGVASAIIVMGMVFSFWGDYFLARKELKSSGDNFAWGVVSFAISQTLFIIGYLMLTDFVINYLLLLLLLLPVGALIMGKLTRMMHFRDNEFVLSMVYGLFLCATLVVTASYYIYDGTDSALVAMIGSVCFLLSDLSLGMYYFTDMKKKKLFNYPIMILYFGAECLYAISLFI